MTHKIEVDAETRYKVITWTVTSGQIGDAVDTSRMRSIMAIVHGTFATGSVAIQGSMDNMNWVGLSTQSGANVNFTFATIMAIDGIPRFIRPNATIAAGLSLTVQVGGPGLF